MPSQVQSHSGSLKDACQLVRKRHLMSAPAADGSRTQPPKLSDLKLHVLSTTLMWIHLCSRFYDGVIWWIWLATVTVVNTTIEPRTARYGREVWDLAMSISEFRDRIAEQGVYRCKQSTTCLKRHIRNWGWFLSLTQNTRKYQNLYIKDFPMGGIGLFSKRVILRESSQLFQRVTQSASSTPSK